MLQHGVGMPQIETTLTTTLSPRPFNDDLGNLYLLGVGKCIISLAAVDGSGE
jgi:hypothetical protein